VPFPVHHQKPATGIILLHSFVAVEWAVMPTVFEWNARKEATNLARHGVGFEEAMTLFADPLGRILDDPRYSHG
jgi:hypothetical protein